MGVKISENELLKFLCFGICDYKRDTMKRYVYEKIPFCDTSYVVVNNDACSLLGLLL